MENMERLHVAGLRRAELEDLCAELGWPRFRARQLFHWIHHRAISDFTQMHNLPKAIVEYLIENYSSPMALELVLERQSVDGTAKYLFALADRHTIEAVYIPEDDRGTLCVSSQVGCAMKCTFCATGQSGFVRSLSPAEIVSQVNFVRNRLSEEGPGLTNIVFMGMGEPFANFEAVMNSIDIITDREGMNLGQRRITISTCGLADKIREFADLKTQVNLAISLHAPDDERRSEMMPINKRFPIEELLDACRYYTRQTNRRISFEYALIAGINDSTQDAAQLAELLEGMLCHLNLIPVNPVNSFSRPDSEKIERFQKVLAAAGIPVSVRRERGTDIEAACGQLRQVHGTNT